MAMHTRGKIAATGGMASKGGMAPIGAISSKGEMGPLGGKTTKGGDEGDAKVEPTATPMERLREAALKRGVHGIQSMGR